MPGYTDLSRTNGWIPEPVDSEVITRVQNESAVEGVARKVNMTSESVRVPRFAANGVDVVPEHAVIPLQDATLDTVELVAVKFSNRHAISVEDNEDAAIDELAMWKREWASNFATKLDNAVFGTVGAQTAVQRPFTSVYQAVGTGGRLQTAAGANISYEDLVEVFGDLEAGKYGNDLVAVAHPSFKMQLRNLKDADNVRVVQDPLNGGVPTIFGYELRYSNGARTSTVATDDPTGNPLLIVGSKRNLILGVRSGPESAISDQYRWETDHIEAKMRARRGFAVADPTAFRVIERLPSA